MHFQNWWIFHFMKFSIEFFIFLISNSAIPNIIFYFKIEKWQKDTCHFEKFQPCDWPHQSKLAMGTKTTHNQPLGLTGCTGHKNLWPSCTGHTCHITNTNSPTEKQRQKHQQLSVSHTASVHIFQKKKNPNEETFTKMFIFKIKPFFN